MTCSISFHRNCWKKSKHEKNTWKTPNQGNSGIISKNVGIAKENLGAFSLEFDRVPAEIDE